MQASRQQCGHLLFALTSSQGDIFFGDLLRLRIISQRLGDVRFAYQVNSGIGRTVGVVSCIFLIAISKTVLGMKAGQLIDAFVTAVDNFALNAIDQI